MQRGQHQVARLRGLDRDFRRFEVADFADHDHVGVLAQEAAQGRGEGHALLDVHLHLVDARDADFDRVLGGGDVALLGVEDVQAGVQRHRLARAGGAGDQDHAVGLGEGVEVELLLVLLVAQLVDAQLGGAAVQQSQHHLLAEQRRAGGDAEVHLLGLGDVELDAPVLRQAALGDVELGHDLEAGGDAGVQLHRGLGHAAQDAVHAQADAELGFIGFEVDVRGAALDGVQQHLVDEAHHRRVVAALGVGDVVAVVVFAAGGLEVFQALVVAHAVAHAVAGGEGEFDGLAELFLVHEDGFDREVGGELDLVQGAGVGGVGDAHEQAVAALVQRQGLVLADQLFADELGGGLAQVEGGRVEQRHAELHGIGPGDVGRGDQLLFQQVLVDRALELAGLLQGLAGVGLAQGAVQHEAPGNTGDADQIGGGVGVHSAPQSRADAATVPEKWPLASLLQHFLIVRAGVG